MGVSGDNQETLEKFKSQYAITFPLITDTKKKIRKSYGRGRRTYLIDKTGIVRFKQKGVPKNEMFLQELQKLKQENP